MARVQDDVVVDLGEPVEALDHQRGVAAGQVGAPTAIEEECVARHQLPVDQETLAAGGVARCVDELDLDVSDLDDVA